MALPWTRLPFRFEGPEDYARRLQAFIGEAFYERLPAAGYQVREEQVYFAYRVAAALQQGRPILAEAGSGTGKTFAYLLPAICHARLRGRPVAVATASAALQQQLCGPEGDVAALSELLGLEVDARVAEAPEDVLCDVRVERAGGGTLTASRRRAGRAALLRWAAASPTGVRSEHPEAGDELWQTVAWGPDCRCDVCPRRGYCRLTRARERARAAADIVVCGHDLLLQDTLGRDGLPPGRLPVLPPVSGIVFDEGHRVALSARRAAGARLRRSDLRQAIAGTAADGVRLRLIAAMEAALQALSAFEERLAASAPGGPEPGVRRGLRPDAALEAAARALVRRIDRLQDEMAVEQGLHEETGYAARLEVFSTRMDAARAAVAGLPDPARIAWLEAGPDGEEDLWVVPRELEPLWRAALPRVPLVFSSATLAGADGSFAYTAGALGLDRPLAARAGVPFRLARQVLCYVPRDLPSGLDPAFWDRAAPRILRFLQATGGRCLVLVPGPAALRALRGRLDGPQAPRLLWEGDASAAFLVEDFAADTASVLVSWTLWEGIDVPGEALSAVLIPQLPLPGPDPLVEARRQAAAAAGEDPFAAVDVPDMALRLKQGVGRLIRRETDRGVVAVLDGRAHGDLEAAVDACLPEGARRVRTLPPVERFLGN